MMSAVSTLLTGPGPAATSHSGGESRDGRHRAIPQARSLFFTTRARRQTDVTHTGTRTQVGIGAARPSVVKKTPPP